MPAPPRSRLLTIADFDVAGLHYAVRILIASAIAWLLVGRIHAVNPLWAVITAIAVSEPKMKTAWNTFKAQVLNTMIGCSVGLFFMYVFGTETWLLPIGATLAAIISIHLLRMEQGWRISPTTVALVMSAGLTEHSAHDAMHLAYTRALGVFAGSLVALFVTWAMTRIWMPETVEAARQENEVKHS